MHKLKLVRLMRTLCLTALVLGIVGGSAVANRSLEVSPVETRATARAITFSEASAGFEIICEEILTIRLNARIAKLSGTAAGNVTGVEVRNCRGGNIRALTETLPWPIEYNSFTGTLPSIATVTLSLTRTAFLLEGFLLIRCLYEGPVQGITGGGTTVTEITTNRARTVSLKTNLGGAECLESMRSAGTFTVSPNVRLRLV